MVINGCYFVSFIETIFNFYIDVVENMKIFI